MLSALLSFFCCCFFLLNYISLNAWKTKDENKRGTIYTKKNYGNYLLLLQVCIMPMCRKYQGPANFIKWIQCGKCHGWVHWHCVDLQHEPGSYTCLLCFSRKFIYITHCNSIIFLRRAWIT